MTKHPDYRVLPAAAICLWDYSLIMLDSCQPTKRSQQTIANKDDSLFQAILLTSGFILSCSVNENIRFASRRQEWRQLAPVAVLQNETGQRGFTLATFAMAANLPSFIHADVFEPSRMI